MAAKKSAKKSSKDLRAQVVAKAIADPAFRKKLLANPHKVFGAKLSQKDLAAVDRLKTFLPALNDMVRHLAGEVLCGGGGGCGGLA